jgi:hypothetical protein
MKSKKVKLFVFSLILIVSPLLGGINNSYAADIPPAYTHLSWQNDTLTTMTMSWKTSVETASIVQYGIQDVLENEVTGVDAIWHAVELTDLQPDTIYKYRVGNGESCPEHLEMKEGKLLMQSAV